MSTGCQHPACDISHGVISYPDLHPQVWLLAHSHTLLGLNAADNEPHPSLAPLWCRMEALRQIVPHSDRANTAAFLEDVVKYVEGLQARVRELEGRLNLPQSVPNPVIPIKCVWERLVIVRSTICSQYA